MAKASASASMAASSHASGGVVAPDGMPSGMPARTMPKNFSFIASCSGVGGSSLGGGVRLPLMTRARWWHAWGSDHCPALRYPPRWRRSTSARTAAGAS